MFDVLVSLDLLGLKDESDERELLDRVRLSVGEVKSRMSSMGDRG